MSAPLRCDVAVIGGGAAGLAAAAGAAQAGARTVLVERYGFLGGAATHSSVLSYCGFYTQGEDPLPVVGGIGLMVLTGMARLAVDPRPRRSPTSGNWVIPFDPEAAKVAMDRVAQDTGVHVLLHARMIGARREGKRVTHVQVLDHAGPRVIEAAAFVDASGDANLAHAADGVLVGAGAMKFASKICVRDGCGPTASRAPAGHRKCTIPNAGRSTSGSADAAISTCRSVRCRRMRSTICGSPGG
jgi:flavin-dependent dehydrogenase